MKTHENYLESMHKLGRTSGVIALIIIIAVPALTCWKFGIFPPLENLMPGLTSLMVIFIPICIVEAVMYAPMAGVGGTYLLFVTGNLTNLRIPALMICMETAEVQSATEEGEIISTIVIAASALTTTVIIALGVLLLVPMTPILSDPMLKPAFDNILPALFGALGVAWMSSKSNGFPHWKVAVFPCIVAVITVMAMGGHAGKYIGVLIPGIGAIAVLFSRFLYKKGWITVTATQLKN